MWHVVCESFKSHTLSGEPRTWNGNATRLAHAYDATSEPCNCCSLGVFVCVCVCVCVSLKRPVISKLLWIIGPVAGVMYDATYCIPSSANDLVARHMPHGSNAEGVQSVFHSTVSSKPQNAMSCWKCVFVYFSAPATSLFHFVPF